MKTTKKILVLGISQSNFLTQLYGGLKAEYDGYEVSIDGFTDLSKGQVASDTSVFDHQYAFSQTKQNTFLAFLGLLQTKFFWKLLLFELSVGTSPSYIFSLMQKYAKARSIVRKTILPLNHNLYHFHFCDPENLKYLQFFPKGKKVICSFWGSDLMRINGVRNVFYVTNALRKATTITIQSPELAEMLYCKYGRDLQEKVSIVQFTINTETYSCISTYLADNAAQKAFKSQYNIPEGKYIIAISHNAFAENNHLRILNELATLPESYRNKIAVIMPLGYGGNPDYIEKLKQVAVNSPLEVVCLTHYFGSKEVAFLRLITDIMIQMPVSDALSGAMTEVLYAQNHVLAGAWLPYGLLRRKGVAYEELETFSEINNSVISFLDNENNYRMRNATNPECIRKAIFPEVTTTRWNAIFEKTLSDGKA